MDTQHTTPETLRYLQATAAGMFTGIQRLKQIGLSTDTAQKDLNGVLVTILEAHYGTH